MLLEAGSHAASSRARQHALRPVNTAADHIPPSPHSEQSHGFEVVEPKVANLQANNFRDAKAGHGGQRGEQPVPIESHQRRAPPKQVGHDAFMEVVYICRPTMGKCISNAKASEIKPFHLCSLTYTDLRRLS